MLSKSSLKEKCISIIQDRMEGLKKAMKEAQDAANEETKSSSGDKYETTRAMNQLDKDMYARQLLENTREMTYILETDCEKLSFTAVPGSFVKCNSANFFLLAGIGKISEGGESVYIISPNAPLAKSMLRKGKGESFLFNNHMVVIESII